MKKRNILYGVVSCLMALSLVVAACTPKPTPTPVPTQTGVIEIRAMDAPPTGVSKIMVTTSNIQIHKADAPEDSWITVVSQEKTFDLVAIQGAEVFLGSANVSPGNYTQIRLDVTKVIVTMDGKDITAKLPSDKLKIVRPWEVKAGQKTILTLDFDADKFVVITGNDQAQVKPVIKLEVSHRAERALKKPAPDTTAPTVTLTINANGATDVPVNTKVNIYFNEDMDPSTITTTTFTLKKGTTPIAGTVTYVGRGAFFTPAANLQPNTEYTATITTGAKDLAGNALASPYIWRWTTAAAPDTTQPAVSSSIPAGGATGVAINSAISAIFSEAMDPLTLTNTIFTLKQGTTPVAGTVTYIGVTATFTPAVYLTYNTEYTATITTGAKDLAGNALWSSRVWNFTTGAAPDITAPTVSSTIPANGATGVAINSAMSATFSEAMDPLTLTNTTFTLKRGTTPVAGTVTYAGVTAIFDPDLNLASGTEYTAIITTGAKDLAGTALASNFVWTFRTAYSGGGGGGGGEPTDTTAPTVSSTIPANAATGVAVNSAMSAIFSEAMNPVTVTTATFTLKQGATSINGTVTYAGVTATFTPAANLAYSTEYTTTITTVVTDLAGNHLAANKIWTFTTGVAPDATPPTVSSTIPANAATGVAINSAMSAVFSEAMLAGTVTNVNFTLKHGATPDDGAVTYVGVTATFTPAANLAFSTEYTATITTAVTDLAGNHLAVNKVWTFTTGVAPDVTPPTVSSTIPANAATGVAINSAMSAVFSEAMIAGTVTNVTFTLVKQGGISVDGAVNYAGVTATFTPSGNLTASANYTATITTAVTDLAGNLLAVNKVWTFTTGVAPLAAVNLGTASNFAILSKSGISTTGTTSIVGNIGVSPIDATAITGFGLIMDASNQFSTSSLVTGNVYAANYAVPTPANMTTAISDMETAYTDAAGRTLPAATELGAGNIGGLTLAPGLYKWGTGVLIPTNVTLAGGPDDVWIFQISQTLTVSNGAQIILSGGAQPKNIFWQVFGDVTLGTTSVFNGNILCQTQIIMQTGSTLNGRALAQTQVTLDAATVVKPAP